MSGSLADAPFDRRVLERELDGLRARLSLRGEKARWMERPTGSVVELLDATPGATLQQRWSAISQDRWARWEAGEQRLAPERQWTWGPAALVLGRAIRPGWELLSRARLSQWLAWLPANDPQRRLRRRRLTPAELRRLPRILHVSRQGTPGPHRCAMWRWISARRWSPGCRCPGARSAPARRPRGAHSD